MPSRWRSSEPCGRSSGSVHGWPSLTYHDIDHLWQLPRFLAGLQLGYRFSISHFTMHDEETVLYGWVPGE